MITSPLTTKTAKKQEKAILKMNSQKEVPLDIKYTKEGLSIQGQTYVPKVAVPTPKQIVDHTPEELQQILKLKLDKGGSVNQDKSTFRAYTASIKDKDYNQIRQLYVKMKLIEPAARHITCSYIADADESSGEIHYTRSYCDDSEPGAGKQILDMMIRNKIYNRVIFVARMYGGIRMGQDRFECYAQAAKAAIQEFQYNSVLKVDQMITVTQKEKRASVKNTSQKKAGPESLATRNWKKD